MLLACDYHPVNPPLTHYEPSQLFSQYRMLVAVAASGLIYLFAGE